MNTISELLFVPMSYGRAKESPRYDDFGIMLLEQDTHWGGKSLTFPVALPFTNSTMDASSIYDILYNQLHFLPSTIFEFGNVYQDQVQPVYIWNTTDHAITVDSLVSENPEGSAFELGLDVLPPLSTREGTLYVYRSGPAQTNATYVLQTSVRTITVVVTCSRVIIFPLLPNWASQNKIGYTFETVVEQNTRLYEQRRALTLKPLRTASFSVTENGGNIQKMRNLMMYGDGKTYLVPLFAEPINVVSATANTLTTDSEIALFWNLVRLCKIIVIYDLEAGEIVGAETEAVDTETGVIRLAKDLSFVPTAGKTVAFPGIIATLGAIKEDSLSDSIGTVSLSFVEFPGIDQPTLTDLPDPPAYFPLLADWGDEPTFGFEPTQQLVMYSGTAAGLYSRGVLPPATVSAGFKALSRSEMVALLDFFCSMRGRTHDFLFRAPHNEFRLLEDILPDDGEATVEDNGFDMIFDASRPQRIWIMGPGGTIYDREIRHAVSGNDGTMSIGFNETLGVTIPAGSFIGKTYFCRFSKDAMEIEYLSDAVCETQMSFYELIHEETEL
jgi:hypothetical protein